MNTHAENIATLEKMIHKLTALVPLSQKLEPYQQNVIALKIYEFENYLNYCVQMEQQELEDEKIIKNTTAQA